MRAHRLLIPFAALLAVFPLLWHGPSCGHDFDFHLLNWLEAAHQIGAGHYPHWAYIPAWNAGEPRFLFYPPLSWLLGAGLTAILPFHLVPAAYTFCCLTLSGVTLYRLARLWTSESAATVAAIFYLLNPYSLFTAYERTAYGELLAAALIPLLFHAILRPKPTIPGIAVPLALLWLTNAPAAVMSTYALALLALVRLASGEIRAPFIAHSAMSGSVKTPTRGRLALAVLLGTALGLLLPAFYLIPAAYERRWVEIGMAIVTGLRPQDNFLFHHTPDDAHDAVLHTASLIAVLLLAMAAVFLAASAAAAFRRPAGKPASSAYLLPALTVLVFTIAFLLTPWSGFIWSHAPELAFLQFPWRTCALLACVVSLLAALALRNLTLRPQWLTFGCAALSLLLIFHPSLGPADPDESRLERLTTPAFIQGCEPEESPIGRQQLTPALANTAPTDEYTPTGADNDVLKPGDPPFWIIPHQASAGVDQAAPAGVPAGGAPDHLTLDLPAPAWLVMNRRQYPAWRITVNGRSVSQPERQDGLIAVALPGGHSRVDLVFRQTKDRLAGIVVSLLAGMILLAVTGLHRLMGQKANADSLRE